MAKGGSKKGAANEPEQVEEDPAVARVREFEAGVGHVLGRKPTATQQNRGVPSSLRPRDLKRWNGCDIVRKGGRKTRYVFVLPATLTLDGGGGKLGTLAKMDTETPVLYIEFPQGRLRCQGRIVRPQMRLLPLSFEGRASVTCKDIVNTVVVFSEMAWVGTAEANPEEKPLPFPAELRFTRDAKSAHDIFAPSSSSSRGTASAAASTTDGDNGSVKMEEDGEGDGDGMPLSQRPRRASTQARKRYREKDEHDIYGADSGSEESEGDGGAGNSGKGEDSSSDEEDPWDRLQQHLSKKAPPPLSSSKAVQKAEAPSDAESSAAPAGPRKPIGGLKPKPKLKPEVVTLSSDSEDEADEDEASQPEASRAGSGRAAAAAAKKKMGVVDVEDDSEDGGGEDEEKEQRPKKRRASTGSGAGGGSASKRRKRVVQSESEESSESEVDEDSESEFSG